MSKAMQLKAKIKNLACKNHIPAQAVLHYKRKKKYSGQFNQMRSYDNDGSAIAKRIFSQMELILTK